MKTNPKIDAKISNLATAYSIIASPHNKEKLSDMTISNTPLNRRNIPNAPLNMRAKEYATHTKIKR